MQWQRVAQILYARVALRFEVNREIDAAPHNRKQSNFCLCRAKFNYPMAGRYRQVNSST
jgi:hypothetical protein